MSNQPNLNTIKLDLIARIIRVDDLELLKKISKILDEETKVIQLKKELISLIEEIQDEAVLKELLTQYKQLKG